MPATLEVKSLNSFDRHEMTLLRMLAEDKRDSYRRRALEEESLTHAATLAAEAERINRLLNKLGP
jgi:hypothetical protein